MKPKLETAYFEPTGGRGVGFPHLWSVVGCSFSWSVNQAYPQLRVTVPLERDREQTYAELERQVQDHAVAILREALAQLEARPLREIPSEVKIDWGLNEED